MRSKVKEAPQTIVFLLQVRPPILDFTSIKSPIQKYKVVVVERGYGFSEDSDRSRDVMEVLSETRQAWRKLMFQVLINYFCILWLA